MTYPLDIPERQLDPPDDPYEVRRRPTSALQDEARLASREAEMARKTKVQRHN
jgi:hypothetical protein